MENNELFITDEAMDNSFDDEYEVSLEMDGVNPWMIIATGTGSSNTVA